VTDGATAAEALAAFAVASRAEGVPAPVQASALDRIIDITGLQLAALSLDTSRAAIAFAGDHGGIEAATAVGCARRMPASWAAFVNGVLAHSLDFDDTHLPSVLHPSASVVPATLSAAELVGADGPSLLRAVAVGVEAVARLGMVGYDEASANSVYFEHGQHATSICGAVGSALAAGAVLGLDEAKLVDAVGIAASMASGVLEANRTGGTVKRLHCGWAAHAALSAVLLARHGFTGPPTALEGRFGLFEAFLHGLADVPAVTRGLGSEWAVPGIFFKPYPANHFTHTAIDAARLLRARGLVPEEVRWARLGVAGPTVRTIGEPLALKQRPVTGYQAQFSGPFAVAVGLLGGGGLGAALEDYTDERAGDHRYRAIASVVEVVADDACSRIYPYQFPARLRVGTHDGRELEAFVAVNRGGPDNPLSAAELRQKFRHNASQAVDARRVDELERALDGLPECRDVRPVTELLRPVEGHDSIEAPGLGHVSAT